MRAVNSVWRETIDYDRLIAEAEVRNLVSRYAARNTGNVSAEAILQAYDQVAPLVGGIKLEKLAAVVVPLLAKWGVGTGKTRSQLLPLPPGHVLAAAICSLSYRGRELQSVEQAADGVMLVAKLPSDLWTFEGSIAIGITNWHTCTEVQVTTKIGGQMFDWGKSNRSMSHVFDDISRFPEF
jgi:hypothetical protein